MNLVQIRLIKLLVENGGNISLAAQQLHIAQSALSRRLQQLEAELKQNIFYRNGKRLDGLTPFGQQILHEIDHMLQAEHNINALSADYHAEDSGTLSIATTHAQARYFLPEMLKQFSAQYPKVRLKFHQGQPSELLNLLHRNAVDFIICTESLDKDKAIDHVSLYRWRHILGLPKTHPLNERDTITLSDLQQYPLLTYIEGITGRRGLAQHFTAQNLQFQPIFSAADSDVLIEYIKSGFGVGILCGMARDELDARGLHALSMGEEFPYFETRMGWLKERKLRRFERRLKDMLIDYAARLHWR